MRLKTLIIGFVCSVQVPFCIANTCELTQDGSSYDLRLLQEQGVLNAKGGNIPYTFGHEPDFEYYFDACAAVDKSKLPNNVENDCSFAAGTENAVYQYSENGICKVAGKVTSSSQLSIINKDDPSAGVKIVYENGDTCGHNNDGTICEGENCPKRKTLVEFRCSKTEQIDEHPTVYEVDENGKPSNCEYKISYNSMLACPLECGRALNENGKDAICAGHGICGYDQTNKKSACFCDEGWRGRACSEVDTETTSSGGNSGILIVLLLMTISLLVLVALMSRQMKAYRDDARVYLQVRGDEMMTQLSTI